MRILMRDTHEVLGLCDGLCDGLGLMRCYNEEIQREGFRVH